MSSEQPISTPSSVQRRLALVIGVNEAANSSLPALKHSIDDATKMAEVLRDSCGFELFQPPLLGEHATSERVKSAVLALARERSENDFLLLYFSGHGQPMTISGDQPDIYLATHNFSEREAEEDETLHFSMRWLQNKLYIPTQAGRILLILDCCYAGNIGMTATNPYLQDLKARLYKFFGQPMGSDEARKGGLRLALTATGHDQTAGEQDGYGLMTKHLIEALQGKVDEVIELENQGKVSLQRVQRYLETVMPATQNPSVEGGYAGKDCVLAQYAERAAELRRKHTPVVNERPHTYIPFVRKKDSFQPRPHEFETLERMLFPVTTGEPAPPRVGLVGVIGMGGIGKTQLAVELAYRYKERFPSGVFWTPATGTTLPEWQRQFAELAISTDYLREDDDATKPDNEMKRASHLCRYLASHADALLILDNVENTDLVLNALTAIAGKEAQCTILYTSRNTITPHGVKRHVVERLPEDGAMNLLLTHKPTLLPLALQKDTLDAEAQAARTICQYVDYLPLALTLLRDLLQDEYLTLAHLAEQLKQRGAFDITKDYDETETRLFTTFQLSWEKITDAGAQRLFKLAAYFPEATAIPLWLLGIAARLGETGNTRLEPLGRARLQLQKWSMIEVLTDEQIRLHPLIREFGQQLTKYDTQQDSLLQEAGERLATEFVSVHRLEKRASQWSFWRCLEQVQAAIAYARLLESERLDLMERIEYWLMLDTSLLGPEGLWSTIPGLFYQQLYNHAIEAGYDVPASTRPQSRWIRQTEHIGTESQAQLRLFRHPTVVTSVIFSHDNQRVLTGCDDGTVYIWDMATSRIMARLVGHSDSITSIDITSDSRTIVTGSLDNTVRIWDSSSGQTLRILVEHASPIISTMFSADSSRLATASKNGVVRVWNTLNWDVLAILVVPTEAVSLIHFFPSGKKIAFCSSTEIVVGNVDHQKIEHRIPLTRSTESIALSCSPDEQIIFIADPNSWSLFSIATGKLFFTYDCGITASSAVFSLDGNNLVTISDKEIDMWNVTQNEYEGSWYGHTDTIVQIRFSPDSTRVVSASLDKTARVWDTVRTPLRRTQVLGTLTSTVFSPDGSCFLLLHDSGYVIRRTIVNTPENFYWETLDRFFTLSWYPQSGRLPISCSAFSSQNMILALGTYIGKVQVLDLLDASPVPKFFYESDTPDEVPIKGTNFFLPGNTPNEISITSIAVSSNGDYVLTGSDDEMLYIWEVATKTLLAQSHSHQSGITCVAFAPDSTRVVSGGTDGVAVVSDTALNCICTVRGHNGTVYSVCFSPDSTQIATGALDGSIRVCDASTGKILQLLRGHTGGVTCMTFSPDGRMLLTGDRNGQIFIWQVDGRSNSPLGTYFAADEVGAVYWKEPNRIVITDTGAYFCYHLALEGDW